MKMGNRSAIALVVMSLGLVGWVQASPIMYGDFDGGTVMYTDVTETANTDPMAGPMFGPPELRGAELDFDPMGFIATSMGGPFDINDVQLNYGLMTEAGSGLTALEISEGGDYSFAGVGGAGTSVTAGVGVWIEILEVDFQPLPIPIMQFYSTSFMTDLASEPSNAGLKPWTLGLTADLAALIGPNYQYGVTKANVVINNQLITNSEPDSLAFIAKKDFKLNPVIVPEPATAAIMLIAGMLVVSRRR